LTGQIAPGCFARWSDCARGQLPANRGGFGAGQRGALDSIGRAARGLGPRCRALPGPMRRTVAPGGTGQAGWESGLRSGQQSHCALGAAHANKPAIARATSECSTTALQMTRYDPNVPLPQVNSGGVARPQTFGCRYEHDIEADSKIIEASKIARESAG